MNMDDLVLKCIEPIHLSDLGSTIHAMTWESLISGWSNPQLLTSIRGMIVHGKNWGFDMIESSNIGIYNMIHISE